MEIILPYVIPFVIISVSVIGTVALMKHSFNKEDKQNDLDILNNKIPENEN